MEQKRRTLQVIFNTGDLGEGKKRAIGVEFIKDGSHLWAAVKKDVILSAGTSSNSCRLCTVFSRIPQDPSNLLSF